METKRMKIWRLTASAPPPPDKPSTWRINHKMVVIAETMQEALASATVRYPLSDFHSCNLIVDEELVG